MKRPEREFLLFTPQSSLLLSEFEYFELFYWQKVFCLLSYALRRILGQIAVSERCRCSQRAPDVFGLVTLTFKQPFTSKKRGQDFFCFHSLRNQLLFS